MTILLSDEECGKMAQMLRLNKFRMSLDIIYPEKSDDLIPNFIKAIRFLTNLSNSVGESTIKEKIQEYLKGKIELRDEAIHLHDRLFHSTPMNRSIKRMKMVEFTTKNRNIIEDVIDTVVPIGRVVRTIDPDQTAGYY